jgi:hypothetical protein
VPSQPAVLVVVPCGRAKVWDKNPQAGSTAACDAYIGSPFKVNRQYAERFGDRWVILSAKHGFLRPHDRVPEPYDVTFKRQSSRPISATTLRQQARALGLDRFDDLIGLGGKDYRRVLEEVFAGSGPRLHFPFAGMDLGRSMAAAKRAVQCGQSSADIGSIDGQAGLRMADTGHAEELLQQ